ncbi:D-alanyl-D-alanine carboxypeptidase family protein [Nannocystis pusilla]|uniref:D-alanyl-D-alanine carboxypeptidase family protein n=1 Tax=Nannocystis pusilla TaxID=889268 RepID=UPI003B77C165
MFATPAWAGSHEDAPMELADSPAPTHEAHEPEPDDPVYFDGSLMPTYAIDCDEHEDVGYVQGNSFTITVVTVDGKPVEVETANAYYAMQQAAAADGVGIKVVSGFRTMAEQQYLYNCYINCIATTATWPRSQVTAITRAATRSTSTPRRPGCSRGSRRTATSSGSRRRCRARTGTGSGGAAGRRRAGRAGRRTTGPSSPGSRFRWPRSRRCC